MTTTAELQPVGLCSQFFKVFGMQLSNCIGQKGNLFGLAEKIIIYRLQNYNFEVNFRVPFYWVCRCWYVSVCSGIFMSSQYWNWMLRHFIIIRVV